MKKALDNVLAIAFAPKRGYTPVVGDDVKISAAWEIDIAVDGDIVIGKVEVIDTTQPTKTCTVRCAKFHSLEVITASALVNPGNALVSAGSKKVRPYVSGTDEPLTATGVAVEGATGDGVTFHALLY